MSEESCVSGHPDGMGGQLGFPWAPLMGQPEGVIALCLSPGGCRRGGAHPHKAVPRTSSCSGSVLQGGGRKSYPLSVGRLNAGPRARRTELPTDTPFPGSSPREGQRK